MKIIYSIILLMVSTSVFSQHEGDTTYKRCPVAILDTATGNNYFIEHQPASVKAYRNSGDFTIVIEQKGQLFTMIFGERKLSSKGKYKITTSSSAGNHELRAKYSFKSGGSVAYIDVSSGKAETSYDKATKLWHIKFNGLIGNMGDTRVTYFKATADFFIL